MNEARVASCLNGERREDGQRDFVFYLGMVLSNQSVTVTTEAGTNVVFANFARHNCSTITLLDDFLFGEHIVEGA